MQGMNASIVRRNSCFQHDDWQPASSWAVAWLPASVVRVAVHVDKYPASVWRAPPRRHYGRPEFSRSLANLVQVGQSEVYSAVSFLITRIVLICQECHLLGGYAVWFL
jgi:hypothetical protein